MKKAKYDKNEKKEPTMSKLGIPSGSLASFGCRPAFGSQLPNAKIAVLFTGFELFSCVNMSEYKKKCLKWLKYTTNKSGCFKLSPSFE